MRRLIHMHLHLIRTQQTIIRMLSFAGLSTVPGMEWEWYRNCVVCSISDGVERVCAMARLVVEEATENLFRGVLATRLSWGLDRSNVSSIDM